MPLKTRTALSDDPDSSTSTLGNMLELPGTSSSSTSQELPFRLALSCCPGLRRDSWAHSILLHQLELQ
uniref:Nuclear receptor binding SET domain protein 1 n=1 Tax=Nomascus leucogenys TaxID=61853 RepID=A0A2I3G6N0_NOMLE